MGLMQIMPANLDVLEVADPFNPHQNIMGGVRYLREMLERFDQDLQLALAAYNAGPGVVEQYRAIPPFPETREYIQRVLRFYRLFQKT
jgi:soluble lytic murein transglycosylase